MKKRTCRDCKKDISKRHSNAKCCEQCAAHRANKPQSSMTESQKLEALILRGLAPREYIAEHLCVSLSSLKRAFPGIRFSFFNRYHKDPDLVARVCAYYESYGKRKTQKEFPDVCVRSIVERYKQFAPRQIPWKPKEIIALVRMAGLVSFDEQARYFNRPQANAGSIRSVWMKKFGFGSGSINGMPRYKAKHFVKATCPQIKTGFQQTKRNSKEFSKVSYLWCDMELHLRKDCPKLVRGSVETMAMFQRWLFDGGNVRLKMDRFLKNSGMEL